MKLPLYHNWTPDPSTREGSTFSSSNIRLENHSGWELKANSSTGKYPTGGEHYVVLPAFSPTALRRWLAIDAVVSEPKVDGSTVGTVRFRLKAGASTYWWTGAAWATPSTGNWNTLEEIQANLSTFPSTAKSLSLVARLLTTNENHTPSLLRAGVAAEVVVTGQHYAPLYRGLVRRLKTVRPIVEMVIDWAATGTTHSLASLEQEEPVTIANVVEVYNYDTDPDLATDLFSSWNSGTSTITATGSIAAGTKVWIRATTAPIVAYTTSPDYKQTARLPYIEISEFAAEFVGQIPGSRGFVSRADGSAVVVKHPRQYNGMVKISGVASRPEEAFAFAEAALNNLRQTPLVSLPELDETIATSLQGEITMAPSYDETNTHRAEVLLKLWHVNRWHEILGTGHGVLTVNVTGDMDATLEG